VSKFPIKRAVASSFVKSDIDLSAMPKPVTLLIRAGQSVSGLFLTPPNPHVCYIFAHGAGAGMAHPFMTVVATGLASRGIATLRYQFPYMERGSRRPDPSRVAHATVRAAVAEAARRLPGLPLLAGGKSFGGRMTSQAQAESPLPGVHGLVFFGFPLHPAGKPSDERAAHLSDVAVPMLFLQGMRDTLADTDLLRSVIKRLGGRATLQLFPDADHSFHVPARSGRKDADVMEEMLDVVAEWNDAHVRSVDRN
jgi:predicted alpha/beta-hydrolase family hydrolase